jgi:hypothetical protein
MYIGTHRTRRRRSADRLVGPLRLALGAALVSGLVLPTAAVGDPRARECLGQAPTAVAIQQAISSLPAATTFTYEIAEGTSFDPAQVRATATITFAAGQTVGSITVGGLRPDPYTVRQEPDPSGPFAPASDVTVTVAPPACPPTVDFTSLIEP